MSHALRTTFVLVAALAFASPASGQQTEAMSETQVTQAESKVEATPPTPLVMARLAPAVRFDAAVPSPRFQHDATAAFAVAPNSQNIAMIIVGGAGLVIGAVVGGDAGTIVMIAGGSVALLGLWRYLS